MVVGLDPVLNWSRKKNVVSLSPGLNWSTLSQNSRINNWNQNSRLPCKFASSFNNFDKHGHTLWGPWEQSSFSCFFFFFFFFFFFKLRAKCGTCVVVDKTRTTYGHGLMDLRTYLQYTDCITKYGPIIQGSLDKPKFNCDEDVVSLYDNASGTYISSAAEMVIANMVFSRMQNLC